MAKDLSKKIIVEDGSGDKMYFTILPNYVLNHSTLWDREVYSQMKRIAGEVGECFMSEVNLAKQCGMSRKRLRKSIGYLLEHKWIEGVGTNEANKYNPFGLGSKKYRITNIWSLNNKFYEDKKNLSPKHNLTQEPVLVESEPVLQDTVRKTESRRTDFKKTEQSSVVPKVDGMVINKFIDAFKPVNPSWERIFSNTTERTVAARMILKHGRESMIELVAALPGVITLPFAPRITTPTQLERKFGELMIFMKQEANKKKANAAPYVDLKAEARRLGFTK